MDYRLAMMCGIDLPIPQCQIAVHQPRLSEIGMIGEQDFFIGCGFLDFSKSLLDTKDKTNLENYNDFDILMSMMMNRSRKDLRKTVDAARNVLMLMFPLYAVEVRNAQIILTREGYETSINKDNFQEFKTILQEMFSLKINEKEKYNPSGDMSTKIAEKLNKRHKKLAELSGQKIDAQNISILNRYASILSVGTQKSLPSLMQYTVYQLYDEFQRFQLKMQWDTYVEARMAGAKDLEEVDNWMIDLADQGKTKNKKQK